MVKRGEVWLCALDPTVGSEIQKTRPCLIISPDELNRHFRTATAAPLTTGSQPGRFRIPLTFQGKTGFILLEQIRTLDRLRFLRRVGAVNPVALQSTLATLRRFFAD